MNIKLSIKNLYKSYDNNLILKNINFDVYKSEFLSIIGPSGCGKTTLFKTLIGIEKPDRGSILKDNVDISKLDISKRNIGLVFQDYALFPHMTVFENIKYPLKFNDINNNDVNIIVSNLIKKLNLEKISNKFPSEISGGQAQRTAIARTLAIDPEIILLDEPLSSLDYFNKLSLKEELISLNKEMKKTVIYITHDHEEAFSLSDRIMILNNGQVEQIGTPLEIYSEPKTDFVKSFFNHCIIEKENSIKKITDWNDDNNAKF